MTIPLDRTTDDARNRAWRTFWQGLGIDVGVAVALAVGPAVAGADFAFTTAYWASLGLLVVKTVAGSIVSYIARKKLPPPSNLLP